MGTRGTMAVRVNGQTKGMYNHWDSYYSGLGEEMLTVAKTLSGPTRQTVKDLALALVKVPSRKPTALEIAKLKEFTDLGVSSQSTDDWYCLLRKAQGDLLATLRAGFYDDFPVGDEEYSYVIDFDAETFECWAGDRKTATFPLDDLPKSLRVIHNVPEDQDYYGDDSDD